MQTCRALTGVLIAAAVTGCTPRPAEQAAAPPALDSAAVVNGSAAFWQQWVTAALAGDVNALAGMLIDSVRIDAKGIPPIIGKAAFLSTYGPLFQTSKVNAETITPTINSPITNELAYQIGDYAETVTTGGKTNREYGRFAAAVRKDPDGQWRLAYIMAFPDSTVPAKP